MVKSIRTVAALLAGSAVSLFLHGSPRAQKPLSITEALHLRSIVNPQLGDGFVAFNMVVPRPIADGPGGSYLHLGVIDSLDKLRKMETPKVRWLVDGKNSAGGIAVRPGTKSVSFTRGGQVLVQPIAGGEAKVFADTPRVRGYKWRPDGKAIAFTVTDPRPPQRAEAYERGIRPVIVDEDWRHVSLWMVEEGGEVVRLTRDTTVYDFAWSADGTKLACACAPENTVDASYMKKRLHLLDVASGKLTKLVDNPGKLGDFAFSPAGHLVAYISAADRNDPHAGSLFTVPTDGSGKATPKTHGFRGMVQHLHPTPNGFLVQESVGVRTRLRHLDASAGQLSMFEPKGEPLAISGYSSHGDKFVFTASNANHPAELFLPVPAERSAESQLTGEPLRLTDSNPGLAEHAFGEQRVVKYRTRDGLMVEGVLVLPIGYEQGKRYPMVIVAHGGPESHYSNGWLTTYSQWGHLLAARGIVSWYPNYRSSTGYGVTFCKHDHGDPMGKEFDDHLDAIAYFDKLGMIDRTRVGIGGGSYGGYTAAWAATRGTRHFAAAVSFVPFVDMRTKWLTTDIPLEFYYVHYQEKWPWQQPGLLADRSPLNWAEKCDTPLLLLGGTSDPRVHPSQPFMLYRAVKFATDTPVRYVQYAGEGHGNRMNVNRLDYTVRTLRWFEHYLLGDGDRRSKERPGFDLTYPK